MARERKEGRQAKYDAHYADNIARDRRLKENAEYDSDDEYGDGGSAHTKYEERWVIPTAIHRTLLRTRRRFCGPGSDARPAHLYVRRSRKAGKDHERERQRAVAETKRMNKQMTNVLESPITAKHLIISLGEKTFLALPKRGMLADGHCALPFVCLWPQTLACCPNAAPAEWCYSATNQQLTPDPFVTRPDPADRLDHLLPRV